MKISSFKESEVKLHFKKNNFKEKKLGLEFYLAPSSLSYGKILVITPRKSGKSVQRNLIRRRLKSIFLEEKLFENKIDCIIVVRPEAINLNFYELKKIILDVFQKYIQKNINSIS